MLPSCWTIRRPLLRAVLAMSALMAALACGQQPPSTAEPGTSVESPPAAPAGTSGQAAASRQDVLDGSTRHRGGLTGPAPRLIVLISMDTLRADRLKSYGYHRETAPRLTGLSQEAIVFERVAAQVAQTLLSHKSIFTARYPLRLFREVSGAGLRDLAGIPSPRDAAVRVFSGVRSNLLPALQAGGYRTVGFTDGGWMRTAMGFAHGFDIYDDQDGRFEKIIPRTVNWLEHNFRPAEDRLFLFVHAYDIHCPYESREPYDTLFCPDHEAHLDLSGRCGKPDLVSMNLAASDLEAISNHYDGGIASADAWVGELLDYLQEADLYEEAMIVVTSDHGDSLGEHHQIGHGGLYIEQLMVPLIIRLPRSWEVAPARVSEPAELVDVMPTILDAAGLVLPDGLDGRSLLPLAAGVEGGRAYLTAQIGFREGREGRTSLAKRAILEPSRWLVIYDGASSRAEAFDLQEDPLGLVDVSGRRPPRMMNLLSAMRARDAAIMSGHSAVTTLPLEGAPLEEELDPALLEELRSLGYID